MSIVALKKKVEEGPDDIIYDVDLSYLTSRGKWYYISWKGNNNISTEKIKGDETPRQLDCNQGFGSTTYVTGCFGFFIS